MVTQAVVSGVAPLYNDSDILEPFVTEVTTMLKENYALYELVLVDDGSTDDTVQKATELLSRHDGIGLVRLVAAEADRIVFDETVPGSGLGLAIVADIAEMYDGSIELGRAELGGLKATLDLPAPE